LPFGFWALIVLTRQEVRAAFEAVSARRGMILGGTQGVTPPRSGNGGKAALAIALAVVGVLLGFLVIAGIGLFWARTRQVERRQMFEAQTQAATDLERRQLALMEDMRRSAERFGQAPDASPAVPVPFVPGDPVLPEAPMAPPAPASPEAPLPPETPVRPPSAAAAPAPSRDDLQARLNAVREISAFTRKDQAAGELAKAAAAAGEADIALAALNQMAAFTVRDKAAAEVAAIAATAGNGSFALNALNNIAAFTVKDQACYECAVTLGKSGQGRDANRIAALIADFTKRDRCLAELAGQTSK
jgi:hypothetical protein